MVSLASLISNRSSKFQIRQGAEKLLHNIEEIIWQKVFHEDDGQLQAYFELRVNDMVQDAERGQQFILELEIQALLRLGMGYTKEGILKRLANTSREVCDDDLHLAKGQTEKPSLPKDEGTQSPRKVGVCSILFVAVCRGCHANVNYLLQRYSIDLDKRCSSKQRTVLAEVILRREWNIMTSILNYKRMPASQYINIRDANGQTPLYSLVWACFDSSRRSEDSTQWPGSQFWILREKGVELDTIDVTAHTPLHYLASCPHELEARDLMHNLLSQGAEVNTQSIPGRNSPLHDACKARNNFAIWLLLEFGANPYTLNSERKSSWQIYFEDDPPENSQSNPLYEAVIRRKMAGLSFSSWKRGMRERSNPFGKVDELPDSRVFDLESRTKADNFVMHVQHRWDSGFRVPSYLVWEPAGVKVSNFIYYHEKIGHFEDNFQALFEADLQDFYYSPAKPEISQQAAGDSAETRYRENEKRRMLYDLNTWEMLFMRQAQDVSMLYKRSQERKTWTWLSLPSNNMTWFTDIVLHKTKSRMHKQPEGKKNINSTEWPFFRDSIQIRESSSPTSRLRRPHVMVGQVEQFDQCNTDKEPGKPLTTQPDKVPELPYTVHTAPVYVKADATVSIVVPFLDFEVDTENVRPHDDLQGKPKDEQEYSKPTSVPFMGLYGLQQAQTLDQTVSSTQESESIMRTKNHQVVNRWSQKPVGKQTLPFYQSSDESAEALAKSSGSSNIVHSMKKGLRIDGSATTGSNMQCMKTTYLVIRQVWLWKLADNTILTAIPTRNRDTKAGDLIDTMRHADYKSFHKWHSLVKHIMINTVLFPEQFEKAGLGEHVLDIFQCAIFSEADNEAKFVHNFARKTWTSEAINSTIKEAAKSTLLIKDIRDELRLLRQLFQTQLEVIQDLAETFWPTELPNGTEELPGLDHSARKSLREELRREVGLDNYNRRIDRLDRDAAAIQDSLNTIIQAMQAQSSLHEAKSSRHLNLMILPFTVVTVIFTPLSFMTSLFAVNSQGFPRNKEGELDLPKSWLVKRMVGGEFASLAPLLLLLLPFVIRWIMKWRKRKEKAQKNE